MMLTILLLATVLSPATAQGVSIPPPKNDCTSIAKILSGSCSVIDFCSWYNFPVVADTKMSCGQKSNSDGELTDWYVKFESLKEVCFDELTDSTLDLQKNNTHYNNRTGYCKKELTIYNFTKDVFNVAEQRIEITQPPGRRGSFVSRRTPEKCSGNDAVDHKLVDTYCDPPCADRLIVNDVECTDICIQCGGATVPLDPTSRFLASSRQGALSCTNVHPKLVQSCSDTPNNAGFFALLNTYFEEASSPPTVPPGTANVPTGTAPVASPTDTAPVASPMATAPVADSPMVAPMAAPVDSPMADAPVSSPTSDAAAPVTTEAKSVAASIGSSAVVVGMMMMSAWVA